MGCATQELNTDRAVELNIKVKRNDTLNTYVTLLEDGSAFDFTNYDEANMQVKTRADSDVSVLELTIINGRLTLGGTAGTILFTVTKEDMDIEPSTYVYDLEIINTASGERETVLSGKFQVVIDATRV